MKLSKYIEILQKLQDKYGDVEVVVDKARYSGWNREMSLSAAKPRVITPKTNPRVRID